MAGEVVMLRSITSDGHRPPLQVEGRFAFTWKSMTAPDYGMISNDCTSMAI